MAQGIPIAAGGTISLSTAESANQVDATYDNIAPGMLYLYARGSVATVLATLMVNGNQICRALPVVFFGTTGGLDTSAHLVAAGRTFGGRIILTFRATTGTPTVDYQLNYEPLAGSALFSRAMGRLMGR